MTSLAPNQDLTVCWQVKDENQRNDNTCHANNLHLGISNREDDSQRDEQRRQLGLVEYRGGRVAWKTGWHLSDCRSCSRPNTLWILTSVQQRNPPVPFRSTGATTEHQWAPHLSIKTFIPFPYIVKMFVTTCIWKKCITWMYLVTWVIPAAYRWNPFVKLTEDLFLVNLLEQTIN